MLRLATPLIGAVLFAGCVASSPYDRGSLSEAMERAPNEDPDERQVPNRRDDPPRGSDRRDRFEDDPFEDDDWFEDHHEPPAREESEPPIASDADTLLGMRFGSEPRWFRRPISSLWKRATDLRTTCSVTTALRN